jgi:serine/threonine protein kinase
MKRVKNDFVTKRISKEMEIHPSNKKKILDSKDCSSVYETKHGTVYKVTNIRKIATKFIKYEIDIMNKLNHHNIAKCLGSAQFGNLYYFEMPHYGIGMHEYIKSTDKNQQMTHDDKIVVCKNLIIQILQGLEYIHSHEYIHGDIKYDNIIIDKYDHVTIIDFGLTTHINKIEEDIITLMNYDYVTEATRPPEMWFRYPKELLSYAIDMWSIGCLWLYLDRRETFFIKKYPDKMIFDILGTSSDMEELQHCNEFTRKRNKYLGAKRKKIDKDFLSSLPYCKLFTYDPRTRYTSSELLKYFTQ